MYHVAVHQLMKELLKNLSNMVLGSSMSRVALNSGLSGVRNGLQGADS